MQVSKDKKQAPVKTLKAGEGVAENAALNQVKGGGCSEGETSPLFMNNMVLVLCKLVLLGCSKTVIKAERLNAVFVKRVRISTSKQRTNDESHLRLFICYISFDNNNFY